MQVQEIMTPSPVVVGGDTSIESALSIMDAHAIRHLPVVEGERLVGVVSNRDLLGVTPWKLPSPSHVGEPALRLVEEVMQHDPVTVDPTDQLVSAAVEASTRAIGCLPVVQDGKLVGIVSEMDLIKTFAGSAAGTSAWVENPTVGSVATFPLASVSPGATRVELDRLMEQRGIRHVPILDGDRLVGVVSDRDMRRAAGAGMAPTTLVSEFMSGDVRTIHEDAPLAEAARTMSNVHISALIVTTESGDLGILTTTDVLEYSLDQL